MQTVTTRELEKYVENVEVNVVPVTVVVTDDRGRFVEGLKQKDFEIKEDGVLQKISSFWDRHSPLELVTAIDVSSSVTDALPAMRVGRRLASSADSSPPIRRPLLDSTTPFTRWPGAPPIRRCASGRSAGSGRGAAPRCTTPSFSRSRCLPNRPAAGPRIILFTDGDDQNSHAPLETAIAQVEASDAMIYAVGQGRAVHVKTLQKAAGADCDDEWRPGVLCRHAGETRRDFRGDPRRSPSSILALVSGARRSTRREVSQGHGHR